jgi:hypothetical protein
VSVLLKRLIELLNESLTSVAPFLRQLALAHAVGDKVEATSRCGNQLEAARADERLGAILRMRQIRRLKCVIRSITNSQRDKAAAAGDQYTVGMIIGLDGSRFSYAMAASTPGGVERCDSHA